MAMNGGTVSISGVGIVSGTGLSREIFDSLIASFNIPGGATGAPAKQQIAELCNAIGEAVVAHIQTNAEVTVTVAPADAGLQTTTTAAAPTGPPATPLQLTTKGTID